MRSFESSRVSRSEINSKKFKHPIPVAIVAPKDIKDNSCVFIYSGGLWATISGSLYLNNEFYDNHWFVTYERMAHGDNKNKPSQFKKPYLKEIKEVIDWVKKSIPNRKVYLLGESFGGSIVLSACKKYKTDIAGTIAWNVPMRPKDSEKNTAKIKAICGFKEILTLLTNITVNLPVVQKSHAKISRNELFVRAMSLKPLQVQNSRSIIAVWRYMHSSKHFLLKNGFSKELNFLYIQSGEDALCDFKIFKRITKKSNSNHVCFIPTGYHLLALEPIEADLLYKEINKFISKK